MNSFNCDNILQEITSIEGNSNCFDCKVASPTWASLNNGILLCLQCSQHHRAFGNKISWIRSLEADEWNEQQLRYLQLGGNNRLSEFFSNYPFSQHISPDAKYRSIAAVFYRKSLQSRVDETGESPQGALEEPPTSLEGAKILDFLDFAEQQPVKDPRELIMQGLHKEDNDDIKKIKNALSSMFNKTKNAAEEEAKKVQKKAVEIGEKAKQVSQQLKEQSIVAAEKAAEKTAEVTKTTKQAAQEGMQSLKKNIDQTWSFFKTKLSQPFGKPKQQSSQVQSQPQWTQSQPQIIPPLSKNSDKMSKIDPNNDTPTPNDDQLTSDEKYELQP